jgi:hypothetical protein
MQMNQRSSLAKPSTFEALCRLFAQRATAEVPKMFSKRAVDGILEASA